MAILIIEDEFLVALDIRSSLERAGFADVEHAATESAALAAISSRNWTAAIVDANLDGKRIDAIVAALKEKNVPFVIVTGYGRKGLPDLVADAPVVEKPFNPKKLLEVVTRICDQRGH